VGLDVIYVQDLIHLTLSVNWKDRSDSGSISQGRNLRSSASEGPSCDLSPSLLIPKLVLLEIQETIELTAEKECDMSSFHLPVLTIRAAGG
jgi:hypothetical protein